MPELIFLIQHFSQRPIYGIVCTNGLSALFKSHTIFQVRGLLCYINKAVSCVVRRNSGGRVVVLQAGLSLIGGAELHDGGGIARAAGLASKVQKCATAPVKRSGIAEGP